MPKKNNNDNDTHPVGEPAEEEITAAEKKEDPAAEAAKAAENNEKTPDGDSEEKTVPESALLAETDKFLRLAAEFDNYKKRSRKEREALYSDVRCDTILKILPVYDNLARALQQETADEAYRRGVEMTMAQFDEIFEKMGVKPIDAVGKTFDPTLHNAVLHVDDESRGENEIVEEFEKGFLLGEKVIRFSVVKVAN